MYGQLNAVETRVFETWYRSDVIPEDKLVYKGEDHNIHFVEDINELGRWMRIFAEKGVVC